ncbi:MAG: WecB/TagA/CpsF family glycosyltransferase [Gracilimonas sp.]|nr:WecB/TagA/CpsF family glycosyltransferase [Gracilimonas sp.]
MMNQGVESTYFLGVRVDKHTSESALGNIRNLLDDNAGTGNIAPIYFVNVHSIFLAIQHHKLMEQLNYSALTLADGSGLNLAGKLLGEPVIENLNGTDFTPKVLEMAAQTGKSVYLLGARESVLNSTIQNLKQQYPTLKVAGHHHGYFNNEDEARIIDDINQSEADILLVGMGSPIQEDWIWQNRENLHAKVGFAVGGLFDFLSGEFPRAPLWMRKLGLEWVFRFFNDPTSKWKRIFIEIPIFLPLIILAQLLPKRIN